MRTAAIAAVCCLLEWNLLVKLADDFGEAFAESN